jgi:hypothetical protein
MYYAEFPFSETDCFFLICTDKIPIENQILNLKIMKQTLPVPNVLLDRVIFFSSPCQRQRELLPSLGVCCPLTFHILIFSSQAPQPNGIACGSHVC